MNNVQICERLPFNSVNVKYYFPTFKIKLFRHSTILHKCITGYTHLSHILTVKYDIKLCKLDGTKRANLQSRSNPIRNKL